MLIGGWRKKQGPIQHKPWTMEGVKIVSYRIRMVSYGVRRCKMVSEKLSDGAKYVYRVSRWWKWCQEGVWWCQEEVRWLQGGVRWLQESIKWCQGGFNMVWWRCNTVRGRCKLVLKRFYIGSGWCQIVSGSAFWAYNCHSTPDPWQRE